VSLEKSFSIEHDFGPLSIEAEASLSAEISINLSVSQDIVGIPTGVSVTAKATAGVEIQGSFGFKDSGTFRSGRSRVRRSIFRSGRYPSSWSRKSRWISTLTGRSP
jgi:hypothetical protein